MMHFIGIDISSKKHNVKIIDEKSNQKSSFTISNTFDGFEELSKELSAYNNIKIGMEQPHGPIVDYLHFKNHDLYSLNPLKIKRFKETIKVSGNKNDDIDAMAIAEYLKNNINHARAMSYNSSGIEKLKNLSFVHTKLTDEHTRYMNKLRSFLSQYFPLHITLFSHLGGQVQLNLLLKYPSFDKLSAASDEDLKKFLKDNRYRNKKYTNRLINKIRNYHQLISSDVEFAYSIAAESICRIMLILQERLKKIEKEMSLITDSHTLGKYFKSLPGSGDVLSSKLLAIFGDKKDQFNNYNGAQCLFGTAPKNYQSGNYHRVLMRKACDKSARAILYQFSFVSLRFSKWAREYYDNQRARGKNHSVSIRALSNKWVKIIFKIWKDEIFYDENIKISSVA